jgi:hypothetical protein
MPPSAGSADPVHFAPVQIMRQGQPMTVSKLQTAPTGGFLFWHAITDQNKRTRHKAGFSNKQQDFSVGL